MKKKRKSFVIGGAIVLLAMGYLGYTAFADAATYYYTVGEIIARGEAAYGTNTRVEGQVVDGSVTRDAIGRRLDFSISDNETGGVLAVTYTGVVPDTFKEGVPVVVEGVLSAGGVFDAKTIMPKCPSKYEPEEPPASS